MSKQKRKILRQGFIKSLPILCSYIFLGAAYGMMMENAGFSWMYSLLASVTVYTGAFQFMLITFLSSGASIATIAISALLMNSRQFFYGLTFLEEFRQMGKRKWYMIPTLTDETYAVNCTLTDEEYPDKEEKHGIMFLVAVFSHCYWAIGSVLGGVLGQIIPFDMTGIDFCMTALFVIIFIDQWEHATSHKPALIGLGVAVVCLLIFGKTAFMLPALLIVSGILLVMTRAENRDEDKMENEDLGTDIDQCPPNHSADREAGADR